MKKEIDEIGEKQQEKTERIRDETALRRGDRLNGLNLRGFPYWWL